MALPLVEVFRPFGRKFPLGNQFGP
jgi:hypothetical protein